MNKFSQIVALELRHHPAGVRKMSCLLRPIQQRVAEFHGTFRCIARDLLRDVMQVASCARSYEELFTHV